MTSIRRLLFDCSVGSIVADSACTKFRSVILACITRIVHGKFFHPEAHHSKDIHHRNLTFGDDSFELELFEANISTVSVQVIFLLPLLSASRFSWFRGFRWATLRFSWLRSSRWTSSRFSCFSWESFTFFVFLSGQFYVFLISRWTVSRFSSFLLGNFMFSGFFVRQRHVFRVSRLTALRLSN